MLTFQQQRIYGELERTAAVFFESSWTRLPVKPRFSRFISGPTGTGKSFLVRTLAYKLKLPILELTASSWIPIGASDRAARSTWLDIASFIQRNPKGIIFLDEVDKVTGHSSWMQYIRVEMFQFLDRKLPDSIIGKLEENEEDSGAACSVSVSRSRLSRSIFMVGAGSFQDLRDGRNHRVSGFGDIEEHSALDRGDMADVVPREIVNRFSGPILHLSAFSELDYSNLLEQVSARLPKPLAEDLRRLGHLSMNDAIDSQIGFRWIEELLLQALSAKAEYGQVTQPMTSDPDMT